VQNQSDDRDFTRGLMEFHWAPVFGGGYRSNNRCEGNEDKACKSRDDLMRVGHLYISGVHR
jgi:hypothetical protein